MTFWWLMVGCNLIVPIVTLIAGSLYKFYPKSINKVIGYRTALSMKNSDTWNFAQEYSGKLCLKLGLSMAVVSVLINIPFYSSNDNTVGAVGAIVSMLQIVALMSVIFFTERELKRNFNNDGSRKNTEV